MKVLWLKNLENLRTVHWISCVVSVLQSLSQLQEKKNMHNGITVFFFPFSPRFFFLTGYKLFNTRTVAHSVSFQCLAKRVPGVGLYILPANRFFLALRVANWMSQHQWCFTWVLFCTPYLYIFDYRVLSVYGSNLLIW